MSAPKRTPWGTSQGQTEICEGVYYVHTAGHGGFYVAPPLRKSIPDYLKALSYDGTSGGWFEEDCAYAAPIIALFSENTEFLKFPDLYGHAKKSLRDWNPDEYEQFFGEEIPEGESIMKDRRLFQERNANKLVVISAVNSDEHEGMVETIATKGGDRSFGVEEFKYLIPVEEYRDRNNNGFVIEQPIKYQQF